jgi:hypothetical protein
MLEMDEDRGTASWTGELELGRRWRSSCLMVIAWPEMVGYERARAKEEAPEAPANAPSV